MQKSLAIVIPAYKTQFLKTTLESLAQQTDKRFVVYVGDDASPEDVCAIVQPFIERMPIIYKRFDTNVGGTSLVQQWRRCVDLTKEDYIWLFSDDDVLPVDAVERFWKFEVTEIFDICRFQLQFIDKVGKEKLIWGLHPVWQSAEDFLKERLRFETLSAASEYIFTRAAYNKYGFVEFPFAWCSDDASWVQMGLEKGIYTIDGLPVQMRMSGENISSSSTHNAKKFEAVIQFCNWIVEKDLIKDMHLLFVYLQAQIRALKPSMHQRYLIKDIPVKSWEKWQLFFNNRFLYKLGKCL